jgi:hypothetical protein
MLREKLSFVRNILAEFMVVRMSLIRVKIVIYFDLLVNTTSSVLGRLTLIFAYSSGRTMKMTQVILAFQVFSQLPFPIRFVTSN